MCVIIVCKTRHPNFSTLEKCADANPHGIGLAYRENGVINFTKGLEPKEVYPMLGNLPFPYVLHFRLASAGSASDFSLNHPFPLSKSAFPTLHGKAKRVLFHNGHVNGWENMLYQFLNARAAKRFDGAWSDTRLAALVAYLYGDESLPAIFPNQKFVLFDTKNIRLFGCWEKEDNGLVFSNYYWKATQVNFPGVRTLPAARIPAGRVIRGYDYDGFGYPERTPWERG